MAEDVSKALDTLKIGMRVELRGKRFYEQAAAQTTDPLGKKGFESLIKEEEGHYKILQAEYNALSGGVGWVDLNEARNAPLALFPSDDEAVEDWISPGASDVEALEVAMEFEWKGYQMYDRAANETDDPVARSVFRFLADAENKHYAFIEKTHEYLTTKGSWYFDEQETPFFEG